MVKVRPDRTVILCDFDNTIVGENVFRDIMREFNSSDWESVSESWFKREISTAESLAKHIADLNCNQRELEDFLEQYNIAPGFLELAAYCREKQYDLYIVSEGLDFYIEFILNKYDLRLESFAHHLVFVNDRPFVHSYNGEEKDALCGNLKTGIFNCLVKTGKAIIVIGDDLTDADIASRADGVFARDELSAYCRRNGIPHVVFQNFRDILRVLEEYGHE